MVNVSGPTIKLIWNSMNHRSIYLLLSDIMQNAEHAELCVSLKFEVITYDK